MPGRRPIEAANPLGRVLQRIRLETGLSRRALGIPAAVERQPATADGHALAAGKLSESALRALGLRHRELCDVALGTLSEGELVIRALGRILDRRPDRSHEREAGHPAPAAVSANGTGEEAGEIDQLGLWTKGDGDEANGRT